MMPVYLSRMTRISFDRVVAQLGRLASIHEVEGDEVAELSELSAKCTSVGLVMLHLGPYARIAVWVLVSMCQKMFKSTSFMFQRASLRQTYSPIRIVNIDIILIIFFFRWSMFNTNFIFIGLIDFWNIISCWHSIVIIFFVFIRTRNFINMNFIIFWIFFADGLFIVIIIIIEFFTSCYWSRLSFGTLLPSSSSSETSLARRRTYQLHHLIRTSHHRFHHQDRLSSMHGCCLLRPNTFITSSAS